MSYTNTSYNLGLEDDLHIGNFGNFVAPCTRNVTLSNKIFEI